AVLPPIRFAEPGTEQPARGFSGLALSADGKTIAMIALAKLWTFAPGALPHEVAALPSHAAILSWSPAGDQVVYSAGVPGAEDVFITRLTDGTSRRVTALAGREFYPAWSPDGARIAFIHQSSGGASVVRVVSAAGNAVADTS